MTLCNMVDDHNLDVAQTEVRTKFLPSGRAALQIETDPRISEVEKDNRDLAFGLCSTALNLPNPSVVQKINANERTNHSDIEISKSPTNESHLTLMTDSNELADPYEDTLSEISPRSRTTDAPCNAETEYDNRSDAEPASFGGEPVLHCVTTSDHSVTVSGPLGSDPLQNPKLAVIHARNFKQTTSNLFNPSSKLPLSPETSHPFELTPCEPLATTSTASVKPTEGLSDDILSRSIRKSLEAEAFSDCGDHPEHHVNASLSPLSESLTMTRAIGGTDSSDESIQLSLTFEDQLKQSHEETIVPFVSDHFKIPSSPPVEAIEYLQSGPYFKPATIFREHNARFSTEAVGAQHLPSSSPQSSASMNSHYAPSSSPLPSSSPVEESSHISPPTSPQHPNEYDNQVDMSASGRRQAIYAEQIFSGYPTYPSTEHMYYKPPYNYEQDSSFLSAGPSNIGAPSYPPQILNHSMAPPLTPEHHDFTNRTNPYPIQATFETSTETPISNIRHDSSGYEMHTYTIPVPQEISRQDGAYYEQRQTNATETNSPSPPLRRNPEPPKTNVVPRPKRSTPAGQRQQQKKLSKPFRSPVVHTPVRLAPKPPTLHIPSPTVANSIVADDQPSSFKAKNQEPNAVASSSSQTLDTKVKHRTPRAASQFKSPLPVTSTPLDEATLVRLTPTIQSLERKLQLLRRALKVREDVQEEVLEGLVKKWSEAGREAAWEVWDVVKDNTTSAETSSSNSSKGKKRSIDESWGWDESGDQKKPKVEKERNWGWDVEPVAEREGGDVLPEEQDAEITGTQEDGAGEDEEAPQPTLGTMLIQLGIAPETLGWDEEEGTFVDR